MSAVLSFIYCQYQATFGKKIMIHVHLGNFERAKVYILLFLFYVCSIHNSSNEVLLLRYYCT
jgi:hypothetical protein